MKRMLGLFLIGLIWFGLGTKPSYADEVTLAQTVQAGQMAAVPLAIHNETGSDHTYQLTVTGLPDAVTATFTQGGPVLDNVTVPANNYAQVTLRIETPVDTPVGHYTAQLSATRDDGESLAQPLALAVENTYSVKITSQPANANAFSGQEFTFEVTAANSGAAPVTNLALNVGAPAKWIVQLDPPRVDKLEPGQTVNLKARVLVPASQVSIDQPVSLNLTSDQITGPVTQLAVRVQNSPNFLIVAGVVIALALAGMVAYFKIKGRR